MKKLCKNKRVIRKKMERTILLTLSAMTLCGYASAETVTTATVIQQPDVHLTDSMEVTGTNSTDSEANLAVVTVTPEAGGGTVWIESPSITGHFTSGTTSLGIDRQPTYTSGLQIQDGYTGTVEIGSGTQITLNGQGDFFIGSALNIESNTAQVNVGDGVGLTATYSSQGLGNGSAGALYNARGTVSIGKNLTARAVTEASNGYGEGAAVFTVQGGKTQIGSGAVLTVSTETATSYALGAGAEGTNRFGDNAQIRASSQRGRAYGIFGAESGQNILGEGADVSASSETGLAAGIYTAASSTSQTGDNAQIRASSQSNTAFGIFGVESGQNILGEGADVSASSETGPAIGICTIESSTFQTGDNAQIRASSQSNTAYGIFGAESGQNILGEGTVVSASSETGDATGIFTNVGSTVLGNHASVTATGETAYGVNSLAGSTTLGDYASIYAKGTTAYGVASQHTTIYGTDDDGRPVHVGVSGVNQIGAGAQIQAISTTGNAYGVYSDNGLSNNIGVNRIGAESQIRAISTDGNAYGVYATQCGSDEIGAGAQIQAVSTNGDAYGVYADNLVSSQWVHIGENSSISVSSQSGVAYGIYAHGTSIISREPHVVDVGSGVDITANGNQGIGVYAVSAVNFLGAARISGEQYSLYSLDTDAIINLTAEGTKIISGDMLAAYEGTINVVMDTGDSLFTGAAVAEKDIINERYGEVYTGKIDISMSNGARWNMTGDSAVTNLALNSGAMVNMTANPEYQTLTVDNFSGNNGLFYMKTDLDSQTDGDKVYLNQSEAGSSGKIQVYDANFVQGKEVTGTRHLLLVTDKSGQASFTGEELNQGGLWDVTPTIENGAYVREKLGVADAQDTEWYLTKLEKTVNKDTQPLLSGGDSVYGFYRLSLDTLRQRRGNQRQQKFQNDDADGLWARNRGGRFSGSGFDSRYNLFQLGYDLHHNPGSVYGFFGERGIASPDYRTGNGKEHTLAGGLYGTWYGSHGSYTDVVARVGRDDSHISTWGSYPDKADYRTREQSLSVEYGKTLYLDKDKELFLEPQSQLVLGHLSSTSYTTRRGTEVYRDGYNSAIGRLGILVGKSHNTGKHPFDYYGKVSWLHEFGGSQAVSMAAANGETLRTATDYQDSWWEAGFGGTYRFSPKIQGYADVSRTFSSQFRTRWQINAGLSWQF